MTHYGYPASPITIWAATASDTTFYIFTDPEVLYPSADHCTSQRGVHETEGFGGGRVVVEVVASLALVVAIVAVVMVASIPLLVVVLLVVTLAMI